MKRHPALVPLSRDHHHTLVLARVMKNATTRSATEAAQAFRAYWETEQLHFRIEEEVLLPVYAAHGDPAHPMVVHVLVDHLAIRRDAAGLAATGSLELLHALGNRLATHVEFEERQLFPLIERTVPEAELDALGARLREAADVKP